MRRRCANLDSGSEKRPTLSLITPLLLLGLYLHKTDGKALYNLFSYRLLKLVGQDLGTAGHVDEHVDS